MSSSILKKRIVVNTIEADNNTEQNTEEISENTNKEYENIPKKRVYMGYQKNEIKKNENVEGKSYESMISDLMGQDTIVYDGVYDDEKVQNELDNFPVKNEKNEKNERNEKNEKKVWMKEGTKKEPRVGSSFQADL
mmetsp:Transcript_5269/g.5396  ORF Transcript_5269/g.5396 Transcript_5269/m.5396 type:complete len:136 (+) Transcript_5269:74-481(+)